MLKAQNGACSRLRQRRPRPEREAADKGRSMEIRELLIHSELTPMHCYCLKTNNPREA